MVALLRVDDVFPETSHRHVAPSGSHARFRPPVCVEVVVVGRTVGIVVFADPELVPPGFIVESAALFSVSCDRFKKIKKNALTIASRITATIM